MKSVLTHDYHSVAPADHGFRVGRGSQTSAAAAAAPASVQPPNWYRAGRGVDDLLYEAEGLNWLADSGGAGAPAVATAAAATAGAGAAGMTITVATMPRAANPPGVQNITIPLGGSQGRPASSAAVAISNAVTTPGTPSSNPILTAKKTPLCELSSPSQKRARSSTSLAPPTNPGAGGGPAGSIAQPEQRPLTTAATAVAPAASCAPVTGHAPRPGGNVPEILPTQATGQQIPSPSSRPMPCPAAAAPGVTSHVRSSPSLHPGSISTSAAAASPRAPTTPVPTHVPASNQAVPAPSPVHATTGATGNLVITTRALAVMTLATPAASAAAAAASSTAHGHGQAGGVQEGGTNSADGRAAVGVSAVGGQAQATVGRPGVVSTLASTTTGTAASAIAQGYLEPGGRNIDLGMDMDDSDDDSHLSGLSDLEGLIEDQVKHLNYLVESEGAQRTARGEIGLR